MKKFYLFTILFALLGINQVWAETVTFDGTADWGNNGTDKFYPTDGFKITNKSHVSFSLSNSVGDCVRQWNDGNNNTTHEYFYLNACSSNKEDKMAQLKWSVDEGYTINVSKIYFYSLNKKPWLQSTGKGYVRTSRTPNAEQKVRESDSWGDATYDVTGIDGSSALFGAPPTPLTNNEYFILKATTQEWQIKTITLTYDVAVNTYTVNYDGNATANLSGSMPQQILTYGETTALNNLAFTNGYSVTFDEAGGSAVEDKELNSEFLGWATASDGEVVYANQKDFAEELKTTTGVVLNLYAKWGAIPSITLPATEKEDAHFAGWYNGDVLVGIAGTVITPTADMNLVAKWTTVKVPHFEGAGQSLKVDETYDGFVFTNTTTKTPSASTSAKFYYIISEMEVTTEHVEGCAEGTADKVIAVEYDGDKTIIKALNQGTAQITFYQQDDEENNIEAGHSATYEFTVSKLSNALKCAWNGGEAGNVWSNSIGVDDSIKVKFSNVDSNAPAIVVTPKSGTNLAIRKECASDEAVDTLVSNYQIGEAVWTVTQPENYKYAPTVAECALNVVELEAPVSYVKVDTTTVREFGAGGSTEITWDEVGAADSVRFTARRSWGDTAAQLHLYGKKGDSSWDSNPFEKIHGSMTDEFKTFTYVLDSTITGVRFKSDGGVNTRYVKDIYIFRKQYMTIKDAFDGAKIAEFAMPDKELNGPATTKTIYIDYSTCADKIKLVIDNAHITFGNTGLATYEIEGHSGQNIAVTLTYSHDALEEIDDATLTIYTPYERKEINVSAKTIKNIPVIETAPHASSITIGQNLADSELTGGEASVEGTFAWEDDTIEPENTGTYKYSVVFTPNDATNYKEVVVEVEVQVTDTTTAVDETEAEVKAIKLIRNGQVFILRDGKVYNLQGLRVE